jgi:hypothetical protein
MTTHTNLTERFFGVLVQEIRRTSPGYLRSPFTVAEIYQSLIPYRTHRDQLGVEMNGDYEDTLLRLLAGEGGYLILESEPVRVRIRQELEHSNPNTGIYREFAAVDVRLNEQKVSQAGGVDPDEAAWSAVSGGDSQLGRAEEPGQEAVSERPTPTERVAIAMEGDATRDPTMWSAPPTRSDGVPERCPECAFPLPPRESLRFCPECGTNVLTSECSECGEVLERAWKYCVACGTPAKGG